MMYVIVLIVLLFCAAQAVRAARLMIAALWLAGVSALVAILLYGAGAYEVAVIELSVGAGLVTVLFVFAISLAGDEPLPARSVVPKAVALALVFGVAALLLAFAQPPALTGDTPPEATFAQVFWNTRSADVLAQVVLIFAGALSVLGLLTKRQLRVKRLPVLVQEPAPREEERS
ncbi:MAG: hypothetical protein IT319_20675 [Anaerolineae bacterium]|nr:hypothetical protein [Anaerolineae bacterium]